MAIVGAALAVAGCGGSSHDRTPAASTTTAAGHSYTVSVPIASFATKQSLAGSERFVIAVRNISGRALPNVAVTICNTTCSYKARRGQGRFRTNLESVESSCRLTGLLDRRHLRAIHIKPWRICSDAEKLDGCNGLLLSPHLEHLFCRGYISFADSGELLVSRHLNPAVLDKWGVQLPCQVHAFRPEQCPYLEFHRSEVFERHVGGRRKALETGVGALVDGATVVPVTVYGVD